MKLDEWRKDRTVTFDVPSGLTVTVRRANLVDLASLGRVPTPLANMVNEWIAGKSVTVTTVDDFKAYGDVVDLVVKAVMVEPLVADAGAGDEGHIGLDELTLDDRTAIFNAANKESIRLEPFRAEPLGAVGTVPDGEGVLSEAEQLVAGA